MKEFLVVTVFVLLGLSVSFASAEEVSARPNIVVILADDLGYGDVQCLNPERGKIRTPHLDKLASQSMTFTDAHSGSSVCTPTRYGLLTGRYAWRTRLQVGVLNGLNDEPLIAADRLTVPSFLKQHGYATSCLGKWHLGFQSDAEAKSSAGNTFGSGGLPVGSRIIGGPTTRGFDYYWGCSNSRTMSALIEDDRVIETIEAIEMLPRLGQRAVNYIAEQADDAKAGKPFFLYLPLTSPHLPILPTPEWQGKSGLGPYGDFVMMTDAIVGDVLAALDGAGIADDTLVIFASDNGCSPHADTDNLEKQGHYASAQYRGYKSDIWDGGHRVPFFVRWPGHVKPNSESSLLICLTDLMATCAAILDAKLPDNAGEDSVSILPELLGTASGPLRDAVIHHSVDGRFAVRRAAWKINFCGGSGGWGKPSDEDAAEQGLPSGQLYDITADVAEGINVYTSRPEVVASLSVLLDTYITAGRSTTGAPQKNDVRVNSPVNSLNKAPSSIAIQPDSPRTTGQTASKLGGSARFESSGAPTDSLDNQPGFDNARELNNSPVPWMAIAGIALAVVAFVVIVVTVIKPRFNRET